VAPSTRWERTGRFGSSADDLAVPESASTNGPVSKNDAAGQMRELDILTVDGAIALMGLFLRARGQCLVPGEIATFREWDALPPWWFYRVGAWAVLPEAHIWREHWPADKRANRTPDAVLRQHCVDRLDASLESAVELRLGENRRRSLEDLTRQLQEAQWMPWTCPTC
jgi:hypothetical protein